MPKDKRDFKCTDAKTCIFTFTSTSAIEGPKENSNLIIKRSNEDKVVEITVKNNANFTLFSARKIEYTIAQNSGITDITVKITKPEAPIQAIHTIVNSGKGASAVKHAEHAEHAEHVEDDDEDDEKKAVFPDMETDDLESGHCKDVQKYAYNNNSCWMDSVLFALFAFPTPFIKHYILAPARVDQIREELALEKIGVKDAYTEAELKDIISYIKKIQLILQNISANGNNQPLNSIGPDDNRTKLYHTDSLRRVLQQSVTDTGKFTVIDEENIYREMDVGEFVTNIFNVFNISNITENEYKIFTSNLDSTIEYKSPVHTTRTHPLVLIKIDELKEEKKVFNLSHRDLHEETDFIDSGKEYNVEHATYNFQTVTSKINNFIILQIPRFKTKVDDHGNKVWDEDGNIVKVKDRKIIYPPLKVKINNESPELELKQIIVHTGLDMETGHYVTYFKCNHKWYLYNDMYGAIEFVGTYTQLLDHKSGGSKLKRNAYLLFYSDADTSKPK